MLITLLVLAAAISKSARSTFTFNKFDTKKELELSGFARIQ
jgi:hypothetical protein